MKVFYHLDPDGLCSAAITAKFFQGQGAYHAWRHEMSFDYSLIEDNEQLVFLDINLPPDRELLWQKSQKIIWVDHHISAIEKNGSWADERAIPGIREVGEAACVLAWRYFFPDEELPAIVKLIGDQDIWRFEFGDATRALHYGLDLFDLDPTGPFWEKYLVPGSSIDSLEDLLAPGRSIHAYESKRRARMVREFAYETEFAGHRAVACNLRGNSAMFEKLEANYDLCIAYAYNGEQYQISLYTTRDHLDVSKICQTYGGGGHAKAAGFFADQIPWPLDGRRLAKKVRRQV